MKSEPFVSVIWVFMSEWVQRVLGLLAITLSQVAHTHYPQFLPFLSLLSSHWTRDSSAALFPLCLSAAQSVLSPQGSAVTHVRVASSGAAQVRAALS